MSVRPVLMWFRRDLRLQDNTALNAALESGSPVLPVFVLDPALLRGERFSPRRLAFMLEGLRALDADLQAAGGRLVVLRGAPHEALTAYAREMDASAVYANADYSPYATARDERVVRALGLPLMLTPDELAHAPGTIRKQDGGLYTVFTPFRRAWSAVPVPVPRTVQVSGRLLSVTAAPPPTLEDVLPGARVQLPIAAGSAPAQRRLAAFAAGPLLEYANARNRLIADPFDGSATLLGAPEGTSYLSPYIRFGMLSVRECLAAADVARASARTAAAQQSVDAWVSELAWREFYAHILHFHPRVLDVSYRPEFERVAWLADDEALARWREGQTGYPVVDAAMRQMNALGWMHNRGRMIVASFLTKHLLIHWREGDIAFMQQLLDGDLASNNGGWQWSAGTGTDAQPYFRVFNPTAQGVQYDPDGAYVRRWVPELRGLPAKVIHQPWQAAVQPSGYPAPMVDHRLARQRALDAFAEARAR